MSKESVLFLSRAFLPKLDPTGVEIDTIRISNYKKPQVNLSKGLEVHCSLADFCRQISANGVNHRMADYLKPGASLPSGNFRISTFEDTLQEKHDFGTMGGSLNFKVEGIPTSFYMDGSDALILEFNKEDQYVPWRLAALSFCRGLTTFHSNRNSKDVLKKPFPVIVQLQGLRNFQVLRHYDWNDEASYILHSLNWEKLMVGILVEWAIREGIPAIYILPGTMNRYWKGPGRHDEDFNRRLQIRYDGTAKHCGFKMQPNGLWGLNTANYQLADITTP